MNRSGQHDHETKPPGAEAGGDCGDIGKEVMIEPELKGGVEASRAHLGVAEEAMALIATTLVENDAREVPTADEEAATLTPMEKVATLADASGAG